MERITQLQFRDNLTMRCFEERYQIAGGTPKWYIASATLDKYSWQGKNMSQNVTKTWHSQAATTVQKHQQKQKYHKK